MPRSTLIGLKVGLLALLIVIAALGISVNAPVTEWLQSAFTGIAFVFAFGFGAPAMVAYLLAGMTFFFVFASGYYLGKRASRKLDA